MKVVDVFSKPVDIIVLRNRQYQMTIPVCKGNSYIDHICSQLEELIFVHNDMTVSREKLLSRLRAQHTKLEGRVVSPFKLQTTRLFRSMSITFRLSNDVGAQEMLCTIVVANVFWIDLHIQPILRLILHFQQQVVDVVSKGLAVRTSNRKLCVEAIGAVLDVGRCIPWTILRIGGLCVVDCRSQAWGGVDLWAQRWDWSFCASLSWFE